MFFKKYLNHFAILIGCFISIYAQSGKDQNILILIIGIVFLMYGLFNISRTIPAKKDKDEDKHL